VREGVGVIASSASFGPVPLPLGDVRGDVRGDVAGFWGQAPVGGLEIGTFGDRLWWWGGSTFGGRLEESRGEMQPFQIIFNPTSAAELSKLPKDLQLQVLGQFRGLPSELLREAGDFGNLSRQGRTLTRYRLGDYRVYFERHPLGVVVHRILSRNTLKDFLYRSSLPTGEDEQLQDNPKFWEMISAAKSVR
jgi:mRNA-degrading endonuclease RelE of RelBE toxin-antitoxin system